MDLLRHRRDERSLDDLTYPVHYPLGYLPWHRKSGTIPARIPHPDRKARVSGAGIRVYPFQS